MRWSFSDSGTFESRYFSVTNFTNEAMIRFVVGSLAEVKTFAPFALTGDMLVFVVTSISREQFAAFQQDQRIFAGNEDTGFSDNEEAFNAKAFQQFHSQDSGMVFVASFDFNDLKPVRVVRNLKSFEDEFFLFTYAIMRSPFVNTEKASVRDGMVQDVRETTH